MPSPEEYIDFLILNGAVEVVGVNPDTGDFLYQFTEKIAEVAPKVYQGMLDQFEKDIMLFWTKGFVSMDPTSPNPVVALTPKAFDQSEVEKLSIEEQMALNELKRMFFL